MPGTFQALLVTLVALLPGALYVWSFERQAGRYGVGLSDRMMRFVGGSAVFDAIFAVPLYWVFTNYRAPVATGAQLPMWTGFIPVAYVAIPILIGTMVGIGLRRGWRWSVFMTGPDPAPRAWDYLFQYRVDGWIRCRMKSGTWLAGAYANAKGRKSYAAGYPEPQDLYLASTVVVDSVTGEFAFDDAGRPQVGTGGLLLRWEEVEYLEFVDF